MADSSHTREGGKDCLVYLISPVHVISSIAALETIHPEGVKATLLIHWPGVNESVVMELTQIVRELTAPFGNIQRIAMFTSEEKNGLLATLSLSQIARVLEDRLGQDFFDELYYAHDIEGGMQQLLCTVFPKAKRICYGDALGNVYEKKVHLSFLRRDNGEDSAVTCSLPRRMFSMIAAVGRRVLIATPQPKCKALEFADFKPDAAALILPVDQSGRFLEGIPLSICSRETVLCLVGLSAGSCASLIDYQDGLVNRYRGRKKYLLLTENSAEGNFIDFSRETEMYCAVIRERCEPGSVIFLKSHPGESLPRNEQLFSRLESSFEVVILDPKFKRYPIELWRDLIINVTIICMSYPVLSLKYLYGIDVIQPMDDAFVEQWFPEWTWASYKNAVSLYMKPLEKLDTWDGNSVLWSGSVN